MCYPDKSSRLDASGLLVGSRLKDEGIRRALSKHGLTVRRTLEDRGDVSIDFRRFVQLPLEASGEPEVGRGERSYRVKMERLSTQIEPPDCIDDQTGSGKSTCPQSRHSLA